MTLANLRPAWVRFDEAGRGRGVRDGGVFAPKQQAREQTQHASAIKPDPG